MTTWEEVEEEANNYVESLRGLDKALEQGFNLSQAAKDNDMTNEEVSAWLQADKILEAQEIDEELEDLFR